MADRKLNVPSSLDYFRLRKDFVNTGIISKAQLESFLKGCLLSDTAIAKWDALVSGEDETYEVDWDSMCPDLPHAFLRELKEKGYRLMTSKVVKVSDSESTDSVKILLELQDEATIETCLMRMGKGSSPSKLRSTVCVSCQVGCKMGCSFCATGTMGLSGNLTAGEILEQVAIANILEKRYRGNGEVSGVIKNRWIRNVVFMGMGEPLDNYDEVVRALKVLTAQSVLSFASNRVTVSTVGFSPKRIRQLMGDVPRVSLALSLHAPTQALRAELVPSAKSVDLVDLMSACFEFVTNQQRFSKANAKRQRLLIEYCLIQGVNDTPECITNLETLLSDHLNDSIINVIPYNPTDANTKYATPSPSQVEAFVDSLRSRNVRVLVRHEFGRDIDGACGQLAAKKKDSSPMSTVFNEEEHIEPEETSKGDTTGLDTPHALHTPHRSRQRRSFPVSNLTIPAPDSFAPADERRGWTPVLIAGAAFVVGVALGRTILQRR
eukprot:Blabericola_migrator_1__4724@NODE_2492_length_2686_cov_473_548683_g1562_i0_p1_GENE_NODE_2492_length_2686_cov_473_548683_g1562_i0NODE_2492_length_2686_cov_473_548683_g1562_i0_p1_ORF_typecomplete_len492_score96_18Fer4_14/PF13394_6/8_1e12Radical_SAM/PF04055_21/2_2e11Fer4_12/PF13353_6/0_0084_NODE_2492_length_2686_cov_473_548683_g1562_i01371612